jgi:hypothetical protein
MNAQVPALTAGGSVAAIIPQSLDDAFRLSKAIALSGLAPRGMDKPEQITVAIIAGAELGLAPFQALQSFAVVNGRPTLWGDGLMAVARAQGIKCREWIDGEGDNLEAHCEVTRPDTGEVIARSFSVADARKASLWGKQGPWQSYPKRMLQMRARAWALRDGCADMLRGFQVREEVEDMTATVVRDITPPRQNTGLEARLAAPAQTPTEGFGAVNGLDPDDQIPDFGDGSPDAAGTAPADSSPAEGDTAAAGLAEANAVEETGPAAGLSPVELLAWADTLKADLDGLSLEQIDAILASDNEKANFAQLQSEQPQVALDLNRAIGRRKRELVG